MMLPAPARLILLCLIMLTTGCTSFRTPRITVLTWNIHHGAGSDGRIDLQRIAKVINHAGADLVALQEVDRKTMRSGEVDQAAKLAELTGMHVEFGQTMLLDAGDYGNAVLSRVQAKSVRVHTLPSRSGEHREPRGAIEVRVEPTEQSGEVAFVSTHLDNTDTPDSDRPEQARALASLLGQDIDLPTVLAGDFNCEPGSAALAVYQRSWINATAAGRFLTWPATRPQKKIDLVLVKPENRWKVKSATAIDEKTASDHRPVKVILELEHSKAKAEPKPN
jgi:endonuclease/exonuclease/phosphatase family metal-dependent hydrolase